MALEFDLSSETTCPAFPSTATGGSLDSVGLSMPVGLFTVTNSPLTSAGTISVTVANQAANVVLAGPVSGGAATPAFRTLVAGDLPASILSKVNDTNVTLTLGGSPNTALIAPVSLTLGWTGQLAMAKGGTGSNLIDPNTDAILFWDDSLGGMTFLTLGANLSITGTVLNATGGGGGGAHVASFNATTDWTGPSGGFYSFTYTHSLGTNNYGVTIWDDTTGTPVMVNPDTVTQPSNNTTTIKVPSSPDLRFAGRIVINS